MSYKLVDAVLKSRCCINPAKAVLVAMAAYANDDGTSIYPSLEEIGEDAGVSKSTVQRAINDLINDKIVTKTSTEHHWGRGHYTVEYVINIGSLVVAQTSSQSDQWSEGLKPVVTQTFTSGHTDPQLCHITPSSNSVLTCNVIGLNVGYEGSNSRFPVEEVTPNE